MPMFGPSAPCGYLEYLSGSCITHKSVLPFEIQSLSEAPQSLLNSASRHLTENQGTYFAILTFGTAGMVFLLATEAINRKKHDLWSKLSNDYVVIHQIPRGTTIPNMSAFALKLETYLRIARIPYKVDTSEPYGPRGKMPWINSDGKIVGDTELTIEHLKKRFKKDLNGKLTDKQKAVAKVVQVMLEEHFYWGSLLWRFVQDPSMRWKQLQPMPFYAAWYIEWFGARRLQRTIWYQGVARHTQTDIFNAMKSDLKAVASVIGNNKFLFGNYVCETDAAVFGILAQVVYAAPNSPYEEFIINEVPNIKTYCDNIKAAYWPDWDELLGKPQIYDVYED